MTVNMFSIRPRHDAVNSLTGILSEITLYAHYNSEDSLLAGVLKHHHQLALAQIETWASMLVRVTRAPSTGVWVGSSRGRDNAADRGH